MIRASANAEYPPVLFGPDTKPARREASEVYSGRWGVLALNVWGPKPENKNVNRFVSLGLQRVQFLDHDEVIASGRIGTAEGFEAAEVSAGSAPKAGGAPGTADELWG